MGVGEAVGVGEAAGLVGGLVGEGVGRASAVVGGKGVSVAGRTAEVVVTIALDEVGIGSLVGSGLALPMAIPTVLSSTRTPAIKPPKRLMPMSLRKDPLAEVFFLQWYQVGGGEFLD